MKVFISWSKERSKYVARTLYDWIPCVIQNAQPWLSEEMPKGIRWSPEVAKELDETSFGIICVTPENQGEAWLNFEAGALSKSRAGAHVCTYLIDIKPTDVVGPLKDFQVTKMDKEETFRLMRTLNAAQEAPLPEKLLDQSLEMWWPKLETKLTQIPERQTTAPVARDPVSIQEETLELVRKIHRRLDAPRRLSDYETADLISGGETNREVDKDLVKEALRIFGGSVKGVRKEKA